jgi:hypothetical protein
MLLLVGPGGSATPPHVARRFPIAADLLPTAHAPGGGADVEMRLSSGLLLAGEATLLGVGQRQMSAEAEPVRLHVARLAQRLGEGRAIGLFVAPSLDLNLVQSLASGTFWIGAESVPSDVVPMTLAQLVRLGDAAVTGGGHPERIESVLRQCLERRGEGEVAWLQAIEAVLAGTSPATLVVREARPAVPRPPSRRTNPPKAPNGERPRTRQGDLFSVAA